MGWKQLIVLEHQVWKSLLYNQAYPSPKLQFQTMLRLESTDTSKAQRVGKVGEPAQEGPCGREGLSVHVAPVGPSDLVKGGHAGTGSAGPTGALETIWGPGGSGLRVSPADEKGARGEACGAESRLSPAGAEGGSGPRDSWIGFVDQGYFGKSESLSDLQKIALLHHG